MPSGPAAVRQRSQRFVPLTLSAQHAEQSGACSAALEEAGPGTEEVCVRPPRRSQLKSHKTQFFQRNNGIKQINKQKNNPL